MLQGETESKLSGRGDSAVSKGTTDSGVVMENRDVPALPGMVPDKLPPLTSESIRESEMERVTQEGELFKRADSFRTCHKILTFFLIIIFIHFSYCFRQAGGQSGGEAAQVQRDPGGAAESGHHLCGTEQRERQRGRLHHHGEGLII